MTEQVSQIYCEVCGIGVKADSELKRFSKYFCSSEHMEQYVMAKQKQLGLYDNEQHHERRKKMRFGC